MIALIPAGAFGRSGPTHRRRRERASNWLTYSGNYQSHRYSSLTQITRENVGRLKPAWIYQVRRTASSKLADRG